MTAYGRAHKVTRDGPYLIEIHSVNRKNLDVSIHLPKEWLLFDMDFRKALSKEVKRGSITVRLTREETSEGAEKELPDLKWLQTLKGYLDELAEKLGYGDEKLSFKELLTLGMDLKGKGSDKPDPALFEEFMEGFEEALENFVAMRQQEGKALLEDIEGRIDVIETHLKEVLKRAPKVPDVFRQKLEKRLKELDLIKEEDQERMMRELAFFAEKADMTEELTRLKSHLSQLRERLKEPKRAVGKELDFILQEVSREVNTASAKAQDLSLTQTLLLIKGEQDKIREQIQNIE